MHNIEAIVGTKFGKEFSVPYKITSEVRRPEGISYSLSALVREEAAKVLAQNILNELHQSGTQSVRDSDLWLKQINRQMEKLRK